MLALGQMLVILVRGVDLSVAANLALCGMLAALFNRAWPAAGVLPVLLLTLAAGGLLGAFNGMLVWKLRLPPIVVTLGTMSVYRGVIYLLSRGAWVNDNEMSREFIDFTRAQFLGLSTLAWLALLCAAAVHLRAAPHAAGAQPVRRGWQPGGRGVLGHRRRAHAIHRVRDLRAPSPGCAATCGWRASRWPTPTSRSASSCR